MTITLQQFLDEKNRAEALLKLGIRPGYWAGYIRGLRRQYHGENFGSSKDHEQWLSLSYIDDVTQWEWAKGYQAGFAYRSPKAAGV